MDAARLARLPLFSSLSKGDLATVARRADEIDVPAGKTVAAEGAIAHEFFVVEEGEAVVRAGDRELARLGPGDFFGEIGLLETERRTASVVAETPMRLVVMFQREFKQLERELPSVAEQIRAAIAQRPH